MSFLGKHYLKILCILALMLGFYRGAIFFTDATPLGFDPGLYRILFVDYINNLPDINFENLSLRNKSAYPPFLGILATTLSIIGYSPNFLLTYGIALLSMFTIFSLYLFTNKKLGKTVALISIIIFCISITQYYSFWLNYFKQILGISLMLIAFFTLERKKYLLTLPLILALFTVHRPTGVFFLFVFLLYTISDTISEKSLPWRSVSIVGVAGFLALGLYIPFWDTLILPLIKPLTTTLMTTGSSGTYLTKEQFGLFNILIIIPSLYGLYLKLTRKELDIATLGYLTGMIWVGFRLFFYSRMYIFFDIFIIILAAFGFSEILKRNKKIFYLTFTLFFILQSLFYLGYLNNKGRAIIPEQEFEFIQQIPTITEDNAIIMVTNSKYSPFMAGYTRRDTLAPGLFEFDKWIHEQWVTYWTGDGETKCNLLQTTYGDILRPFYLWYGTRQPQENIEKAPCFEILIDENGYKFIKIKL